MQPQYVCGNDAAKDVLRFAKIVFRIEQRWQVPIEPVIQSQKLPNERGGLLFVIIFQIEHRPKTSNRLFTAGDDVAFHPLHIDLQQMARRQVLGVHRQQGHRFSVLRIAEGDAAEIVSGRVVDWND